MAVLKKRIETLFERLARITYHHRLKAIVAMALFICFTGYLSKNLTVDTATESMLHKSDPSLMKYNEFRDQFGRSEIVALLVESPDIFNRNFLKKLQTFQDALETETPHLKKITSLVNVRNTWGEGDTLYVDSLISDVENDDTELLKQRALSNPFYYNYVLSTDKKSTALIVETVASVLDEPEIRNTGESDMDDFGDSSVMDTGGSTHYITADEKADVNAAIFRVMEDFQTEDFRITYSGGQVVVDVFNKATGNDTTRLVKIMVLVITGFLFLLFRRLSGVIIPIVIVASATLTTLGLMGVTATPISVMTNILPAFLVSVGIADAVHVLAIFYRRFQNGDSKEDAICYAMGHSGLAIFMTSVTTAAGLLSFTIAEIATISDLGIFASAGVIMAFIYTIILLPALIAISPIKRKPQTKIKKPSERMDAFLLFFGKISIGHPYKIIGVCVVLFVISLYYIFQLHFSSFILTYFPKDHPSKIDLQHMESHLGGSISFEVLVDTKKENGIHDPAILKSIETITPQLEAIKNDRIHVGKVISIVDIVKETNQALHENKPEFYSIPDDKTTISQELLLFENSGSDDLEKITDSMFSKTRISLKTKWSDSVIYETFVETLYEMFRAEFGDRAEITVTGLAALLARTISAALQSMAKSYVIALVVITILMLLLVGDFRLGMLSMCPNLLPIFMVMGLISACGINLDINTLFIGSIAIGLVVDDTIHFMYNFRKYLDETGSPEQAIRETFLGTGRALLITTIVLSMNFFVLMTATLNHSIKFGFFTGLAILFALMSDFFLAPALLFLATRNDTRGNTEETDYTHKSNSSNLAAEST